jgi:hypothetical protein
MQALGVVVMVEILGQFKPGLLQISKAGATGQQLGFERTRGSRYNGARNYGRGLVISLRSPEVTH